MNLIERLQLIRNNPGVYKALDDHELADLLLQLIETKSLFKKAKLEIKDGKDGKDGYTPQAGVDYMDRKEQEALLIELVSAIPAPVDGKDGAPGFDGADAEITDEEIQAIIDTVYTALEPIIPPELTTIEIRDKLERLEGDERLDKKAIRGLEELESQIDAIATRPVGGGGGGLGRRQVQDIADAAAAEAVSGIGGDSVPEFEKVNKNLSTYPYTLNYTGDNLTSVVYTTAGGTITKTLNYTGDDLTSIVLSGDLPVGLTETTKTLSYSGGNLTGVVYS